MKEHEFDVSTYDRQTKLKHMMHVIKNNGMCYIANEPQGFCIKHCPLYKDCLGNEEPNLDLVDQDTLLAAEFIFNAEFSDEEKFEALL